MHADIEKTYAILFRNWNEGERRVEINNTVAKIIRHHFGYGDMVVMDLADMVQKYWFARRDLTDYVEVTNDALELRHITFCIDKVLRQVLNLDAETRQQIREALSGM